MSRDRNRQVKRMCETIGHEVVKLKERPWKPYAWKAQNRTMALFDARGKPCIREGKMNYQLRKTSG